MVDIDEIMRKKKEEQQKKEEEKRSRMQRRATERNTISLENIKKMEREKYERLLRDREKRAELAANERARINKASMEKREVALQAYKEKKASEQPARAPVPVAKVPEPEPAKEEVPPAAAAPAAAPEGQAVTAQEPAPQLTPGPEPSKPRPTPPSGKRPAPPGGSRVSGVVLTSMDRTEKQLDAVPAEVLEATALKALFLGKNRLHDLPPAFAQLACLANLDIACNSFTAIPAPALQSPLLRELNVASCQLEGDGGADFSACHNLVKLNLSNNELTALPSSLSFLPKLEVLDASHNNIASLALDAPMPALVDVRLSHNKLDCLPDVLCKSEKLKMLNISHNNITALPPAIGSLPALQTLRAAHNKISGMLEPALGDCLQLHELDLSYNELTDLPDQLFPSEDGSVPGLMMLTRCNLKHNRFAALPAGFYYLSSLLHVDVRCNLLEEIPSDVQNLYQLNEFLCASNNIRTIAEEYSFIETMQCLSLAFNPLSALPPSSYYIVTLNLGDCGLACLPDMTGMDYLSDLFISGNPLATLPECIFALPALAKLFASRCGLHTLSAGVGGLASLEELDISCNSISEVPSEISKCAQLRVVDMSHNQLETITNDLVAASGLHFLNLSHNRLATLPSIFAELSERGVELVFDSNPFVDAKTARLSGQKDQLRPDKTLHPVAVAEMIGRRPTMEDAFLLVPHELAAPTPLAGCDVVGVFDGHAGRSTADFGAANFFEMLTKCIIPGVSVREAAAKAFSSVNELLEGHLKTCSESSARSSGSTALACVVSMESVTVINLGDTRVVLAKEGGASERLSFDHKPDLPEEIARIRSLGGWVEFSNGGVARVNGILAVSRAIGDLHMRPFVSDSPFVHEHSLSPSDKYLVIACDGLWDEVDDAEAAQMVWQWHEEQVPLHEMAVRLRDLSYCRGSDDNISVMVMALAPRA